MKKQLFTLTILSTAVITHSSSVTAAFPNFNLSPSTPVNTSPQPINLTPAQPIPVTPITLPVTPITLPVQPINPIEPVTSVEPSLVQHLEPSLVQHLIDLTPAQPVPVTPITLPAQPINPILVEPLPIKVAPSDPILIQQPTSLPQIPLQPFNNKGEATDSEVPPKDATIENSQQTPISNDMSKPEDSSSESPVNNGESTRLETPKNIITIESSQQTPVPSESSKAEDSSQPPLPSSEPSKIDCAITPNDPACATTTSTKSPKVDCAITPNDPACVENVTEIQTSSKEETTIPSSKLFINFKITNPDSQADIYTLSAKDLMGWTIGQLPSTVEVQGGASVDLKLEVILPPTGDVANIIMVTAQSKNDPSAMVTNQIPITLTEKKRTKGAMIETTSIEDDYCGTPPRPWPPRPKSFCKPEEIAELKIEEVSNLTSGQIAALSPEMVKEFNSQQIAYLPLEAVNGFTPEQIPHLTMEAVTGFTAYQLMNLKPEAKIAFSAEQRAKMVEYIVPSFGSVGTITNAGAFSNQTDCPGRSAQGGCQGQCSCEGYCTDNCSCQGYSDCGCHGQCSGEYLSDNFDTQVLPPDVLNRIDIAINKANTLGDLKDAMKQIDKEIANLSTGK